MPSANGHGTLRGGSGDRPTVSWPHRPGQENGERGRPCPRWTCGIGAVLLLSGSREKMAETAQREGERCADAPCAAGGAATSAARRRRRRSSRFADCSTTVGASQSVTGIQRLHQCRVRAVTLPFRTRQRRLPSPAGSGSQSSDSHHKPAQPAPSQPPENGIQQHQSCDPVNDCCLLCFPTCCHSSLFRNPFPAVTQLLTS